MRVTDYRTGAPGPRVDSEEEALVVLRYNVEEHLRCLFERIAWDSFRETSGEQRQLRDVVEDCAAFSRERSILDPVSTRRRSFALEPFTERNVLTWPVPPAALRRDAASAHATMAELAADLNRRHREEVAHLLRECADFTRTMSGPVTRVSPREEETWWETAAGAALGAVSARAVADALAAGPVQWAAATEWTPGCGVGGDPFTVCGYRWGQLRTEVRLEPAELLARHLAGDAPLVLYRVFVDYGRGIHEIIWPRQTMACCGVDRIVDAANPPLAISGWGRSGAAAVAVARQCLACGSVRYGSWLTARPTGAETAPPLGVVEALDAIPAETLAAGRDEGLHAIAPELPVV